MVWQAYLRRTGSLQGVVFVYILFVFRREGATGGGALVQGCCHDIGLRARPLAVHMLELSRAR